MSELEELKLAYAECSRQRNELLNKLKSQVQPAQQEPVAWGVDWGKAGDIPCVSIIKRLPGGGIEVVAVEYAPYSYTSPPAQQEPFGYFRYDLRLDAWVQNRAGLTGTPFYTFPPAQRTWVGLTDSERGKVYADWRWSDGRTSNLALCEAIEAKLKEKNT